MPPIRDKKARMREAVINNVRYQVAALREQAVIAEAEKRGQIQVIGGFYEDPAPARWICWSTRKICASDYRFAA